MCLETPGFLKISYRIATEKLQTSHKKATSYREAVESHDKATEKLLEG